MPSLRRSWFAFALAGLAGCGARGPSSRPPPAEPVAIPTAIAASAPPPKRALTPCEARGAPHCAVVALHDAGRDASGRPIHVALLDLGPHYADGAAPDPIPALNVESNADRDVIAASGGFDRCRELEAWRLVDGAPPELLVAICNDGQGASGVGEDALDVKESVAEYTSAGGSAWRWSVTSSIALDPLAVVREHTTGRWTLGPNVDDLEVDWTTLHATHRWFSPTCDAAEEESPEASTDPRWRRSIPIPRVALEPSFEAGGFRDASLDGCSADVDGTGERGFLLEGKPSTRDDASVRVVASKTTGAIFVEVHDDRVVGPSRRLRRDDRLEVWIGEHLDFATPCLASNVAAPRGFAVRVADAKVFALGGGARPEELTVTRASSPGVVRLRLAFAKPVEALAIVYADADGARTERRFATSALDPKQAASLGDLLDVPESRARCRVERGRLTLLSSPREPTSPLVTP